MAKTRTSAGESGCDGVAPLGLLVPLLHVCLQFGALVVVIEVGSDDWDRESSDYHSSDGAQRSNAPMKEQNRAKDCWLKRLTIMCHVSLLDCSLTSPAHGCGGNHVSVAYGCHGDDAPPEPSRHCVKLVVLRDLRMEYHGREDQHP